MVVHVALNLFVALSAVCGIGQLGGGEPGLAEVTVGLPGRSWAVRAVPPGFEFAPPQLAENGKAAWSAGDGAELGFMMSIVVEHAPAAEGLDGCVARFEDRLDLGSREVVGLERRRRGEMAVLEYEVRRHGAVRVDQRNLHGYLWHDDACVEIHLSLMNGRGKADRLFGQALGAVSLVDLTVADQP